MVKIPDTLQEVFNIVSTHLLTQIKRSMSTRPGSFGCAYRGKDGMKCAAGVLIPDDQYNSRMEGIYWGGLVLEHLVENKFTQEIVELQDIHDINGDDDVNFLKKRLTRFAENNNLICNFEV
jgi:hypothetical protein